MSRLWHLGWNKSSHGLSSRPLESSHHQCLKAVCGVWGCSKGSALELLDGTLKLRHCTKVFTMRFPPWSLPRVGNGGGKRRFVTPGHLLDAGGNVGKRVRLTRKTRPGAASHIIPYPGHPTPRRRKRLRPSSSEGEEGEVGVPRNLFPRLGSGWCFAPRDAWNLPSEGTGVGFRLVSPAEGSGALAPVRFQFVALCVHRHTWHTQCPNHNHHNHHSLTSGPPWVSWV